MLRTISIFLGAVLRSAACRWLLLFVLATAARGAEPVGLLKVREAGIEAAVADRGIVFRVGNTAKLFDLHGDVLVAAFQPPGGREVLCAVRWDAQQAPAWVSNERIVTFGRIATTVDGTLRLEQGESLPVLEMRANEYLVQVTRFGRTAELEVPRDAKGIVFELAPEKPKMVAPVATTEQPKPAANPNKPRITIEGSGDFVMIRTNEPVVAVVAPVVTQAAPVAAVTPETTPVVAPVAPEAVEAPTAPTRKKDDGFKLPLVLRDTQSLIVIFVFVSLLIVFLMIQRKMIQRKAEAEVAPKPQPAAPPPQPSLKLKNRSAAVAAPPAAPPKPYEPHKPAEGSLTEQPKLKFVSSKKNQTVILGQQNLLGNNAVGTQAALPSLAASDTALIPSPTVLPERRQGGVLYIGKYQVEQLLGRGRMGVVYKALQHDLNRIVALKLLAEGGNASEKTKDRFMREAQAIARLRHPNIITVYEVGEWEHQPYFTMDFVDGKSLDKMIVKQKLPPAEAARLTRDIALALEYAHVNGIIHRDLKPGNIIINTKGDPVITDFGLARNLDAESAHAGEDILGTPAYMSPEQARGRSHETDARSDVYGIGAILYAMLTGDDPFTGNTLLDTLHKVIHDRPTAPDKADPNIDPAISAICMKAISKDPKKRHQSAAELASDLNKYLAVVGAGLAPATGARQTRPGLFARLFARG